MGRFSLHHEPSIGSWGRVLWAACALRKYWDFLEVHKWSANGLFPFISAVYSRCKCVTRRSHYIRWRDAWRVVWFHNAAPQGDFLWVVRLGHGPSPSPLLHLFGLSLSLESCHFTITSIGVCTRFRGGRHLKMISPKMISLKIMYIYKLFDRVKFLPKKFRIPRISSNKTPNFRAQNKFWAHPHSWVIQAAVVLPDGCRLWRPGGGNDGISHCCFIGILDPWFIIITSLLRWIVGF